VTELFREEQRFPRLWSITAAGIAVIMLFAFGPWAFDGRSAIGLAVGVGSPALIAWWIARARMITAVTPESVQVTFPRPWSSRSIAVGDVSGHAVGHKPLVAAGDQGTQTIGRQSIFSVAGSDGVNLELSGGRKVFIGSQRAGELDAAIASARAHGQPQEPPW
jgi:hypothetical protein